MRRLAQSSANNKIVHVLSMVLIALIIIWVVDEN